MNGINNIEVNEVEFPDGSTITSAQSLVQLDTNNNFTSFNTFNVNLPTSDVNPELENINNNTMLNRFSADQLYSTTDTNDYITGFSRNGNTGVITLTQANTGNPIGTADITTITDEELTAIGTNTNNTINSVDFNTTDGVLTLTKEDGTTLTKDLDGRYFHTLVANDIPNLPASKINSGEFATARIPDIDADKIASGTLGTARIPNLNADKITAGTLAIDRIPDLPYVSVGTEQEHTDETIYGVKTFVEFPKIKMTYPPGLPPVIPDPTSNEQFATKKYVDDTTSAISTNTTAISNLVEATNSSFDTASYTAPILKLTNIAGTEEDITIDGFGDAVLSDGTEASPQTFNGVNTFDSVNLKGNVFTENGGGHISILPIRRTLLSNTFTTNNTGSQWIKIATLPVSTSHTKDITKVILTGGDWTNEPMIITAWFRNRSGFTYQYKIEGNSEDNNGGAFTNVHLFARSVSGGAVDIWVFIDGTSNYCVADWSIDSIEAEVYKNPSSQSSPPSAGSLLFSSGNGSSNTSYPPNLITRQAHHSFHASWNTPNAGNMYFSQGYVFKANYIWSNIGSCYNSTTGKFTAKIRGVYMFKYSGFINESYGSTSRPTLYKNGVVRISSGNVIAQNGNQVMAIIPLDIGDLVHLASSYGRLYVYSHYQYNQFSGSLIAPY
tara:strand:- start:12173 stop:14176 length:2004 start_codon:yes stop_codon:yes gene_type:complete